MLIYILILIKICNRSLHLFCLFFKIILLTFHSLHKNNFILLKNSSSCIDQFKNFLRTAKYLPFFDYIFRCKFKFKGFYYFILCHTSININFHLFNIYWYLLHIFLYFCQLFNIIWRLIKLYLYHLNFFIKFLRILFYSLTKNFY
jgi:hypothetical protein